MIERWQICDHGCDHCGVFYSGEDLEESFKCFETKNRGTGVASVGVNKKGTWVGSYGGY